MSDNEQTSIPVRFSRDIAVFAAITLAYHVVGQASLLLAIPPGFAAPVWPAAGIAFVAMLHYGYRVWPAIFLGSFSLNLVTAVGLDSTQALQSMATGLGIGIGAALQAVCSSYLVRRFIGPAPQLIHSGQILGFLALAGPFGCLVNSLVGPLTLVLVGTLPPVDFAITWWTWWAGDVIGVITVVPVAMSLVARPRDLWRTRLRTVAIPLSVATILVIVLFLEARTSEQEHRRDEFALHAHALALAIQQDIEIHIQAVQSLASLQASTEHLGQSIDRRGFHFFVQHLLAGHPGITALSWNPHVLAHERATYEDAAHRDGLFGFEFKEIGAQGEMRPAGVRADYVVVYFIEPVAGNESVLGLDVSSNPVRRAALHRARDTGLAVVTARIQLIQETSRDHGVLAFVPVYRGGSVPSP